MSSGNTRSFVPQGDDPLTFCWAGPGRTFSEILINWTRQNRTQVSTRLMFTAASGTQPKLFVLTSDPHPPRKKTAKPNQSRAEASGPSFNQNFGLLVSQRQVFRNRTWSWFFTQINTTIWRFSESYKHLGIVCHFIAKLKLAAQVRLFGGFVSVSGSVVLLDKHMYWSETYFGSAGSVTALV